MKLDERKIAEIKGKDDVAIHCLKKEYVRPLFKAMGWEDVERGEYCWQTHQTETCFNTEGSNGSSATFHNWSYCKKKYYQKNNYTIIPFEDLIIPESNLIKALHAVGVGDWLQEGVEFEFDGAAICRIKDGIRQYLSGHWCTCDDEYELCNMISNPALIKPLPRWTPEEREDAKKDKFRFNYVARGKNGSVYLYSEEPCYEAEHDIWCHVMGSSYTLIDMGDYRSLKPGECVSLQEIAGGE